MNNILAFIIVVIFIIVLFYFVRDNVWHTREPFENITNCPNLLLQKGSKYFLVNSNKAHIPGVNPIQFDNLEDYTEFLNWQRKFGIRCPVLYATQMYNTQGKKEWKILPDPLEPNFALPPQRQPTMTKLFDGIRSEDSIFNKNLYPGFDPQNQYIGDYTPLDRMFHQEERTTGLSDNPMDVNWGGARFSEEQVESGKYAGDEVDIKVA